MARDRRPEPLCRKVNTRTRGVHHGGGHDYRHERNTKAEKAREGNLSSMHGGKQNGLDYTPLFRFLLSKVGQPWSAVHSEAVARLDREEPIWWLVARTEVERKGIVRVGEASYYSGLFVDASGILAVVNPTIRIEDLEPTCSCCTHTFNGKPYVRKYKGRST